ncbi:MULTISPECIES: hybrid-cluster NAD(P)-dependent oxidoreductase [Serratia]|uniref:hybrid-cluster NAD(P)-dependent oxidoreductase n=1 Tax=Serratia TaxID=613 RepID=UPI001AE52E24|nr:MULTISPECIES: hybrid-cluster NAD(P)-dependent oxidoreductase [Serratia]MBP1038638.1 hybrid-cluster NAD(P)-dependent oxidoreductase [Serratia fonticola]UAN56304.1 hybrid-cluster NAD(P)-dependent oxidoreductase [Serratia sp. JSRIV004]
MRLNNKPYLAEITVYPVKSTGGISQSQAWVEKQGIAFDRRFMVAREDGKMLTARDFPQLLNVTSTLFAEGLYLSYPQRERLTLKYSDFSMLETQTNVFKDNFAACATTKEANQWVSAILGVPTQLLYTGEQSSRTRAAIPYNISFADGYPLLILSEASLAALNERSVEHFSMMHFRPNLVVSGTNAFDEDGWKRIRIGDVVFEGVKPCTRCILTTIDQQSSTFDEKKEPLRTLSEFRSDEQGNIKFGHNLVALNEGVIKVGDIIEVLEEKPREKFKLHANERLSLLCVRRENISRNFCTFWFESGNNNSLPHYLPGQHLPITIKIEGKYFTRRYTLSSTPSRPGLYAISIKRAPGGRVSNWMHDHFQVGHKLAMETPAGEFYIDDSADKFLLIAAGSGITPMISMLRYLYDNKKAVDVFLYYQCRTREDIAFKLELEHLQTANPNLKVIIALSQPDALWGEKRRCLDTHTLKGIPEIIERQVFVCGPDEFMKNAQRQLLLLGLPESQYHQEAFGLAAIPPSVFTPITLTINGTAFAGHNQQPLLMQAEQTGVSLPYGCRAGFCGQCKVRLVSGRVDQQSSSALSSEEQQSNYVLACCSIPLTDVEVVSEGLGS